ncbi:RecQ family ATP-dependent DNA helicase [Persicimonas caeni]|uniref:ATP-dependent DNA helicase RecQ n=1 Tax=Persicimonas caeni TaxID=2292766 RepID=A0A4Y6PZA4_PERCE|nr:RecQ family ATP-dependent DNA helicase [Persicimonas caeni]QDG53646.1 RecQ family ATP-dependent DNA helicase [Persicimonas caeni]QED34867.1 RecQ family ATP-dependent DNA helicase [Persicimonas caeni]
MTTAAMTNAHAPLADSLQEGLKTLFGFDEFRKGQREAMETIMAGDDALVVMPTGSGKSLCYQLTACVKEGVTLVISPLIALMKDQVDSLQKLGLPATEINSSMSWDEQQRRIEGLRLGEYKLVYVAPERFRSGSFRRALAQVDVSMLAVDEAHCVSQWGHDFRPDYLRISDIRRELGNPQTVALTATATKFVQKDIVEQLDMPDAHILVSGFERPNLFFEVFHARRDSDKLKRLVALIEYYDGESIVVYCATRKQVRQVQKKLAREGISSSTYHGGMGDVDRAQTQNAWMDGEVPVLVATNAFGMGVDKPDVRAVAHYNVPGSVEAYYQEAGRAGRDGDPAHCLLLFNYGDKGIHDFFTENSYPLRTEVMLVWQYLSGLGTGTHAVDADRISDELARQGGKIHSFGVDSILRLLQSGGHIEVLPAGQGVTVLDETPVGEVNVDFEAVAHRREVANEQLGNMLQYASSQSCHQAELLHYFNSEPSFGERCENCSSCSGMPEYVEENAEALQKSIATAEAPDVLIKKLLAGVARGRGKRGAHAVAAMLRGSMAKSVTEAGFDKLSTHGILSAMVQDDLVHLLDMLTASKLVERNEYGCVSITSLGADVMRDDAPMPESLERQLDITLVEPSRRQKRKQTRRSDAAAATGSTYDRTLELVQQGLTPDEIAEERGLKTRTITNHLITLAARGDTFDLEPYLDGDILARMRTLAADWQDGDALRPLKDELPESCSYPKLKIHLAQVLMEREG